MRVEAFFDTSVLAYLMATKDPRSITTESVLLGGGRISVQVLNEFVSVARRKAKLSWDEIDELLQDIRPLCMEPLAITLKDHDAAFQIARRYGFHIYDSLIIASAIHAGCNILYSEDMQHGQVIDSLTIRNPFFTQKQ
jgi:predicted nucleic acid-binding protein